MKIGSIIWYTTIFLALSFFAFTLVFESMLSRRIVDVPSIYKKSIDAAESPQDIGECLKKEKIEGLESAVDPHLQKLSEYQDVCNSFVTERLMIFTDMPKDNIIAAQSAKKMAQTLKEFSQFKVTPIVIIEPVTEWGLIDFKEFGTGFYDTWINTYFSTLKSEGVTDEQMGIWVPFPEANLPYWNHGNADPQDFSSLVNRYLHGMKKQFPEAQASILLNSATYDKDDFDWENGEYASLIPYVAGIEKGLVNSFGIQGFSWTPPADSSRAGIFDAREYLNARLAMEAADQLGVKEIWFNTGSFSSKYTLDEKITVTITPNKRKDILNGILNEVDTAKSKGYNVWINVFAEDKSNSTEATDWSYWKNPNDRENPHRSVFRDFIVKANEMQLPISLFDIEH